MVYQNGSLGHPPDAFPLVKSRILRLTVPMLRTDDFDYDLPPELIASRPPERRDASRMLVVDRVTGTVSHRMFTDFPSYLQPGDLVVLNNTRVVKARFFSTDGRNIELLRLQAADPLHWRCMAKPGKKLKPGKTVQIGEATGTVLDVYENGDRLIRWDRLVDEDQYGHLALPHYMERDDDTQDAERYQTVFADPQRRGAIAAPTAGLHFTPEILAGIPHTFLTLHVGVGTFQPVRAELLQDHVMHSERYEITEEAAAKIESATRRVAIGTTVTRVLEHCAATDGKVTAHAGSTSIFIHPPYRMQLVDALLTNFHLPKSTLFMLVSAMAGTDLIKHAYAEAVANRYRFYSYGDCMLIL